LSEPMEKIGMGWLPDYPDFRDYSPDRDTVSDTLKRTGRTDSVKALLTKVGLAQSTEAPVLAASVDLRAFCSPIEHQLNLQSCTAHAGIGIVEYFEKRATGNYINASRLFVYKVTRNLLGFQGDTGAFLRSTMGALRLFGAPPEKYWPYVPANYDSEPTAFLYSFAENYKAIQYFRLDPPGTSTDILLTRIKAYLAVGLPSMFGFTLYDSCSQAKSSGKIPYPVKDEHSVGGHAVVAVGYDDNIKITNANKGAEVTTGALLIRNSWGTSYRA
jgi:C1A family cysteine protease